MTDSTDSSAQSAHKRRMQPSRKVFDVTRPGRAPVSATSRPVIVSNKPEVQDPMMNARPQHVVADAANALHVPDEPLLMAHNPDGNEAPLASAAPAPAPTVPIESTAAVSAPTTTATPATTTAPAVPGNPEIEGLTDRNSALDEKAEEELAALAVEEVAKIDDTSISETSTTPSAPPLPNAQLNVAEPAEMPQTPDVQASPKPSTPELAEVPSTSSPTELSSTEPEIPETNEELPNMNEIGHVPNSSLSGKPKVTPPKSTATKHTSHVGAWITTLVVLLVLAAVIVDVLLDGGFIVIKGIPHTHFF